MPAPTSLIAQVEQLVFAVVEIGDQEATLSAELRDLRRRVQHAAGCGDFAQVPDGAAGMPATDPVLPCRQRRRRGRVAARVVDLVEEFLEAESRVDDLAGDISRHRALLRRPPRR